MRVEEYKRIDEAHMVTFEDEDARYLRMHPPGALIPQWCKSLHGEDGRWGFDLIVDLDEHIKLERAWRDAQPKVEGTMQWQ